MMALACIAVLTGTNALAAEIKVLTAGAFKPVVTALVPEFEKQTGHKVTVENDTAGALTKRIAGGEAFDLVILTPGALAELTKAGKVAEFICAGGVTYTPVTFGSESYPANILAVLLPSEPSMYPFTPPSSIVRNRWYFAAFASEQRKRGV